MPRGAAAKVKAVRGGRRIDGCVASSEVMALGAGSDSSRLAMTSCRLAEEVMAARGDGRMANCVVSGGVAANE